MTKTHTIDFDSFFNIINGKKQSSATATHAIDSSSEGQLWEVPVATNEDIESAVTAANDAFPSWSRTPVETRKELIAKFRDSYIFYLEQFIKLLMTETGKPHALAKGEVLEILALFDHHLQLQLPEEILEDEERTITTRYVPVGVVAAICPWNFPMVLSVGKVLPALLSGCCIIVKPSPFTPYTALKIIELAQYIFPPGVIQALGGSDSLGPALVSHPRIHKIAFTGSIATGKKIMALAAGNLKRVTLELGGNDPAIVLPDVDIAKVAPEVAAGCFAFSGQICVATKRVYVHEAIYEPFLKAMVEATSKMKVGKPFDSDSVLGPLQNKMQYDRVRGFVDESKTQGHRFALGPDSATTGSGYFIHPSIIDNPPEDSKIVVEEQFGPIVPLLKWNDEADVIARANNSNTGLGASVWGSDRAHAEDIGRQIEAGNVFINSSAKTTSRALFSGQKESGIGGEWGSTGILHYCNAQVMHVFK
ncbi:Aldehyde dehydrogenase [Venustampulla echinocandica]|uniref:aldehyde dehydrogenase (NAD(+)) n=1 Tax=Venustampulla echinocandica TaxID=2656787 RepID=A0A370TRG9_9HELO|nr:Aldehyde dehydrogenase [Venustampulla echinocandica]RDL38137.1 Aldehyde dehydrogenase [Venustampulla echinocandica]